MVRNAFGRAGTGLVLALVVLQFAALPVSASDGRGAQSLPHCVVTIEPLVSGAAASRVHNLRCFSTFAEAIDNATGGGVKLGPDTRPAQLTDATLATTVSGQTIIGIDYEDPNFDVNVFGPSLTWQVSNDFGCTGGHNYVAASMPSGWDNQVSSAKAFAGCSRYIHYENTNYGGANLNCSASCASMGVMNDATSSEKWFDV